MAWFCGYRLPERLPAITEKMVAEIAVGITSVFIPPKIPVVSKLSTRKRPVRKKRYRA